jgi:hypothetical protein
MKMHGGIIPYVLNQYYMHVSGRLHTLATFPMVPIGQETLDAALKKKSLATSRNQNLIPPLPKQEPSHYND